jgi:hypothetical protein
MVFKTKVGFGPSINPSLKAIVLVKLVMKLDFEIFV